MTVASPSSPEQARLVRASFGQARLWFLDQLEPGRSDYNVSIGWRIRGALDVAVLRSALQCVVDRHEILRTTFVDVEGEAWQRIHPRLDLEIPMTDLGGVAAPLREAEMKRCLNEEMRRAFDLARGPLMRAHIIRLDDGDHAFFIVEHHAVCGGESGRITAAEMGAAYGALRAGASPRLPPPASQHADYTEWQREQLTPERLAALVSYWRERLAGAPAALALPTDRRRPAVRGSAGACSTFRLGAELVRALKALSAAAAVTLHMTLLAGFQVLLGRYADQDDILVGSPASARGQREFRHLMGLLVNIIVHRGELHGDPTFRTLLDRTLVSARGAYAHRDLPLERVIEAAAPERDLGRNPLFQVLYAMQDADSPPLALDGLQCVPIRLRNASAKADLSLLLYRDDDGMSGELEYSTDLFDAATVDRMATHYVHLLGEIASDPARPISRLPLITPSEERRIVVDWNRTARPYPGARSIADLFSAQAARTPDAVAVVDGERKLTYSALQRRGWDVARRLKERGISERANIGVCIERSLEEIVAFLGVLFAGCAYVPLDPSHPPERLSATLKDADAKGVVTAAEAAPGLAVAMAGSRRPVLMLGADDPTPSDAAPPLLGSHGEDAAYVMYTSGSTGAPKGVAIPHRAVVRLVCNTDYVELGERHTVAHLSNPAFDAATFEIWGPLLNGGRVAIVPREAVVSSNSLADILDRHGVTTLFVTTALFNQIAQDAPRVFHGREVLFGGEAAEPRWVEAALSEGRPSRLLHVYGPTESTTFATWHEVRAVERDAAAVPIGRPIANTTVYLLDAHGKPVAPGVPGEIHIGGAGLAIGYRGQSELTALHFVADPFDPTPGARVYRTGDRARYRGDGTIEFIGRVDRQVKIRGHRIEPAEVEAAFARLPEVREAAVVMHGDTSDTRRLTAYVVPAKGAEPTPAELWRDLRRLLPDYMVPAGIVLLPALPLTPNGKVDRRALPDPADLVLERKGFHVPPGDPLEYAIAAIWRELLGLASVGVRDNFFEIGGHSLLAARMMAAVERECGASVPLLLLFSEPTIEHLAAALRSAARPSGSTATAINATGTRPPLFFLHGDFSGGGFTATVSRGRLAPINLSTLCTRTASAIRGCRSRSKRWLKSACWRCARCARGVPISWPDIAMGRSLPSKWRGGFWPSTKRCLWWC